MSLFSTLTGVTSGFLITCWSNGFRKVPLLREPWTHLTLMAAGGYVGYKYPGWVEKQREDVNLIRKQRNLPPVIENEGIKGYLKKE